MKYAESQVPSAATQIVARWTRGDSLSQPKIQRPRKVDSSKNAASPSIASGAPKTSPTNFEYTDQFIPNWNSWTSPVATPIAKLMSISVPKKRVNRSHASSPGPIPRRLHDRDERGEPERQRDEEEVVERGRRELEPRQVDRGDGEVTRGILGTQAHHVVGSLAHPPGRSTLRRRLIRVTSRRSPPRCPGGRRPRQIEVDRAGPVAAIVASRRTSSASIGGRVFGNDVAKLLEERAQTAHYLDRAASVHADLGDRERDDVLPASCAHHHARTGACVQRDVRGPRPDHATLPIRRSVSPRWSSTCTAVVGSLTAGDSAADRDVDHDADRERRDPARSCARLRAPPSGAVDPHPPRRVPARRRPREHRALGHEVARGPRDDDQTALRARIARGRGRRSPGSRRLATPDDEGRILGRLVRRVRRTPGCPGLRRPRRASRTHAAPPWRRARRPPRGAGDGSSG